MTKWKTKEGTVIAFTDMTDDHLINASMFLGRKGTDPPKEMRREMYRRGLNEELEDALGEASSVRERIIYDDFVNSFSIGTDAFNGLP